MMALSDEPKQMMLLCARRKRVYYGFWGTPIFGVELSGSTVRRCDWKNEMSQ
jgi:hypothetical protein